MIRPAILLGAVAHCLSLVPFVSRADTDEIADGAIEGLGATDEVFSLPGYKQSSRVCVALSPTVSALP